MKAYFDLPREKKTAYLDSLIKRDLQRQADRKKQAALSKSAAAKRTTAGNAGQTKGQGGPGGPGGRNLSPDQRAAMRRDRLDQSSPSDRAMRGEFAADMRARRQQLGLSAGTGRGGWR